MQLSQTRRHRNYKSLAKKVTLDFFFCLELPTTKHQGAHLGNNSKFMQFDDNKLSNTVILVLLTL